MKSIFTISVQTTLRTYFTKVGENVQFTGIPNIWDMGYTTFTQSGRHQKIVKIQQLKQAVVESLNFI